jgi:fermentation-respiration switch protein FrsA (DUF1100 family)
VDGSARDSGRGRPSQHERPLSTSSDRGSRWRRRGSAGPGNVDKNYSDGSVTQNQYASQVLAYAGLSGAPGATADMGMASGVPSTEAASAQQAATDQQIESDRHDLGAQVQSLLDMLDRAGSTDPNAPTPDNPTDEVLRRVQDASAA